MRRFRIIAFASAILATAGTARPDVSVPDVLNLLGNVTNAARPVANALVIALNLGMPYKVADGLPRETTAKHRPTRDSDIAVFLSDQIVFGDPVNAAISIGDIVLAVGIVELAYVGSRRPRRRGRTRVVDLTAVDEIDLREPQPTASAVTTRSKASSTRRS
jgi:hypothetical protein